MTAVAVEGGEHFSASHLAQKRCDVTTNGRGREEDSKGDRLPRGEAENTTCCCAPDSRIDVHARQPGRMLSG